jgi:hypothetical protein
MEKFLRSVLCGVMAGALLLAPSAFADDVTVTTDGSGNVAVNVPSMGSWDGADAADEGSLPGVQVNVGSVQQSDAAGNAGVKVRASQAGQSVSINET